MTTLYSPGKQLQINRWWMLIGILSDLRNLQRETIHVEFYLTFRKSLTLWSRPPHFSFIHSVALMTVQGLHFPPETNRWNLPLVEWRWEVCCCLFLCTKMKKQRFSLPEQFPKHIWSVFSSASVAVCVNMCVCVCVYVMHFVDHAVSAIGILDASQNPLRQKKEMTHLFLCP